MIRFYKILIVLIAASLLFSCEAELPLVNVPNYGDNGILSETFPLSDNVKLNLEGIYNVIAGKQDFGNTVAIKWDKEHMSIFTGKNTAYMIMQAGSLDSVIIFEGYWRFASGSETGMVSLHIKRNEGGTDLISGGKPDEITINGLFGKETSKPETPLVLQYERPFSEESKNFWIIGHRGGGRNSDRLPASENSVEIIRFAERLGANSIEIDVKMTKDGIPILFHDEYLSTRLINESYLVGEIGNYTFSQLRTFCTLKNGEKIPTLREALEMIIAETNLRLVWLDVKSTGLINEISKIHKEYTRMAGELDREIEICIGIPSDEILDEYLKFSGRDSLPVICELSLSDVRESDALIWAPRWSLGLQNNEVEQMHAENRRAFTWTLDETKFIRIYMKDGIFDGILSNYPSVVAYENYIR